LRTTRLDFGAEIFQNASKYSNKIALACNCKFIPSFTGISNYISKLLVNILLFHWIVIRRNAEWPDANTLTRCWATSFENVGALWLERDTKKAAWWR
jgi:hypothetical protein